MNATDGVFILLALAGLWMFSPGLRWAFKVAIGTVVVVAVMVMAVSEAANGNMQ